MIEDHGDQDTAAPIVAAVDGSPTSYRAAAWAGLEAHLRGRPLHLLVSTARIPALVRTGQGAECLQSIAEDTVAEAARIAQAAAGHDSVAVSTEVTSELITLALLDRSWSAWMVVVGSSGRGGVAPTVIGSLSAAVAGHARCPVAVIRDLSATDAVSQCRPVLVGVDGSPDSATALKLAFEEAACRRVALVAVHAWSDTSGIDVRTQWERACAAEENRFAQQLAGFAQQFPTVPVERVVTSDAPARSLLTECERAQLVVIGSRGRGGFASMVLGSTSVALLHAAECPLIIARHHRPDPVPPQ
ncbi:universal stress protein [Nocardia speluncae]|uniref:Universal stress protein n=1 Tax=Nocardia speluncae TaxID=419477 RepID=A0A846XDY7_9NOCA|nr:universal stress protein [Nocardia speluncae]NKY32950.1 universal stress protein [Nocardia speluncae]